MNRKSHLDIFLRVKRQHCCCVVRAMADRKSWQKKNPVQQITCNKVTRLDCSWGTLHCVWRETAAAFRRAQASTRWLNTQVGFRFFAFIFSLPWLGITCDGLRCIFPFFAMIFSLLIAAMRSAKWLLRLFSWFSACTHTYTRHVRTKQKQTNIEQQQKRGETFRRTPNVPCELESDAGIDRRENWMSGWL